MGKTYDCPDCGMTFESGDSKPSAGGLRLACPRCGGRGRLSGWAWIVAGIMIIVFAGCTLCEEVQALGLIAGAALSGAGCLRLIHAVRARKRWGSR